VFKLDATSKETVLYSFTGAADGALPLADLISDASGNLYGTTELGGASNKGVVFKLAVSTNDFSLSASALLPSSVNSGESSAATVNVSAVGGFNRSVMLSCSVRPMPTLAPKCSMTPDSVNPGGSSTLNVTTAAASLAWVAQLVVWAAGLAFVGMGAGQKADWFLTSLLLTGLVVMVACGDGSRSRAGGRGGTPPGAYTVTVTGISGSLQHSVTVALTVQ
jgi:uncharacterized repeat protein (TIGR03803 family)